MKRVNKVAVVTVVTKIVRNRTKKSMAKEKKWILKANFLRKKMIKSN